MSLINVGAGWKKEDKDGNGYISIQLKAMPIAQVKEGGLAMFLFENKNKDGENHPDWILLASDQVDRKDE